MRLGRGKTPVFSLLTQFRTHSQDITQQYDPEVHQEKPALQDRNLSPKHQATTKKRISVRGRVSKVISMADKRRSSRGVSGESRNSSDSKSKSFTSAGSRKKFKNATFTPKSQSQNTNKAKGLTPQTSNQ